MFLLCTFNHSWCVYLAWRITLKMVEILSFQHLWFLLHHIVQRIIVIIHQSFWCTYLETRQHFHCICGRLAILSPPSTLLAMYGIQRSNVIHSFSSTFFFDKSFSSIWSQWKHLLFHWTPFWNSRLLIGRQPRNARHKNNLTFYWTVIFQSFFQLPSTLIWLLFMITWMSW
jgi:hypothetical protein